MGGFSFPWQTCIGDGDLMLPDALAGDKAMDARQTREYLRELGVEPVIPPRRSRDGTPPKKGVYDKQLYRGRNIVERLIGWLKRYRRFATRYDKLAVSFLAFVHIAFIIRILKTAL